MWDWVTFVWGYGSIGVLFSSLYLFLFFLLLVWGGVWVKSVWVSVYVDEVVSRMFFL